MRLLCAGLRYAVKVTPRARCYLLTRGGDDLVRSGFIANAIEPVLSFTATRLNHTAMPTGKKLFTPGPLGVSATTKQAMLVDLGSRDTQFIAAVKYIREKVVHLAGVSTDEYTCVPMQGAGTMALEAVLSTVVPREKGKVLLLDNGAYGKRQAKIMDALDILYDRVRFAEHEKVNVDRVAELLKNDIYSLVSVVHCETSSGVINPVEQIGDVIHKYAPGTAYFVDAMSSFGAIPLNLKDSHIDYMVSSANKCIEGVPGFSYAVCRRKHLLSCTGQARSFSLDLLDQYETLEETGQFRFTPPTHAMLAFKQALEELDREGGIEARSKRYQENREVLRKGMKEMGFKEFLDQTHKGYIITSYNFPNDPNFDFKRFYQNLSQRGQVIYPGKVTDADCFRIGNIGHLFPNDVEHLLACIKEICTAMGLSLPLND